eukprot:65060_1
MATSKKASARKEALERYLNSVNDDGDNYDDADTLEIVAILGGIDNVIQDFLSPDADNDRLNSNQISRLQNMFTTPTKYRHLSRQKSASTPQKAIQHDANATETYKFLAFDVESEQYELNAYETYLNRWIGPVRVEKIDGIITSFYFKTALLCSLLLGYPLMVKYSTERGLSFYIIIVSVLIWIPYNVIFILSMNPLGFRHLVLNTFEFWLRFMYLIYGYCAALWYYFGILTFDEYEYPTLSMLTSLSLGVCICLLLCVVTMTDVIYMPSWGKHVLTFLLPATTTYICIYLQFWTLESNDDDGSTECLDHSFVAFGGKGFSLNAVMVTAFHVLSVLLWKQFILGIYRRMIVLTQQDSSYSKHEAIVIKRNPGIVWVKKERKKKGQKPEPNAPAKVWHEDDESEDDLVVTTTVHKQLSTVSGITDDEPNQVQMVVQPGNAQPHDGASDHSMSSLDPNEIDP